jgi:hypothetical protein
MWPVRVLICHIAVVYFVISLSTAWLSAHSLREQLNFPEGWFVSGYDLGTIGLIAFGELAACFKAAIPFEFWRLRGASLFLRLGLRGVWTVWLMYAWCADALTVISMPALTDSLPHLIFILAAFCALELSGALMPAIAWTIMGETSELK